jgi:hypothetical protein
MTADCIDGYRSVEPHLRPPVPRRLLEIKPLVMSANATTTYPAIRYGSFHPQMTKGRAKASVGMMSN